MRISDMFLAFPGLVFALAVAGVLGGGPQNAMLALAAISWPKYARLARSQTLALKEAVWMKAARLSGSGTAKLIFMHVLPNIIGPILVTAVLDIGTMMMELAALSFSRPRRKSAHGGMGQHDERYAQSYDHLALDNVFARHCDFLYRS